ncbi:MAG: lysostaphin resistance A-like protein [Blastocatellia bacterium]
MRTIFFGRNEKLRSGWRFAVFIAGFIVVALILGSIGVAILVSLNLGIEPGSRVFLTVNGILMLIAAILVGWLCGKYLEGLPFRALGAAFTKGWLKHLLLGLVFGTLTLGFAVGIAYAFGGLQFHLNEYQDSSQILRALSISFVVLAVAAAFEEALFRGYILQTFSRSGFAWLAIALTSLFFGVVHIGNPNAGLISTANTVLAGIWFGIAYLKTRDLWFVWGMHLMWNWVQGAIFGIEISGLTNLASSPLLKEIDSGPAWLTGETYGVEGGIVATIALVISMAAIWWIPILKPMAEPPA